MAYYLRQKMLLILSQPKSMAYNCYDSCWLYVLTQQLIHLKNQTPL